jgi:hypothetical protein
MVALRRRRVPSGFGAGPGIVVASHVGIEAGAHVIKIFESWAGLVPPAYREAWLLEPWQRLIDMVKAVHPDIPIILFARRYQGSLDDLLALEAGADDIINNGDHFEVLCTIASYDSVAKALQEKSLKPESSEIAYVTSIPVPVSDAAVAKQVMELIDALEALDDVKAVHGNQEIDEKLLG